MGNRKELIKATRELDKAKAPKKQKDIITDPMGQWKYPGQPTRIPGSDITMQGVNYPVMAVASTGQKQMMVPGAEYTFPGADYVDEFPQMKKGGGLKRGTTKSLSGTNKLMKKNPLFKNYKHKLFDPKSKHFQNGGIRKFDEGGDTESTTAPSKPSISPKEQYQNTIKNNYKTYLQSVNNVTPYTKATREGEMNCIHGVCTVIEGSGAKKFDSEYIGNMTFNDARKKEGYYEVDPKIEGFEIGDIVQYARTKANAASAGRFKPGSSLTPVNKDDLIPQHAKVILNKYVDENNITRYVVGHNEGTDKFLISKDDDGNDIKEETLFKHYLDGYNTYDGLIVNRYDPKAIEKREKEKRTKQDIIFGKNSYANMYNEKPEIVLKQETFDDKFNKKIVESSGKRKELLNYYKNNYNKLGKTANMPPSVLNKLFHNQIGIAEQESKLGEDLGMKNIVPENLLPTARKLKEATSSNDDWIKDYWQKNANNVKTQYKTIDDFKKHLSSNSKLSKEAKNYLFYNSPKSKGVFQQKELSERGKLLGSNFDTKENEFLSSMYLAIDNYSILKNKYPDLSEDELVDLTTLMHNAPGKALTKEYVDYYLKNNDIDYVNKVKDQRGVMEVPEKKSLSKLIQNTNDNKNKLTDQEADKLKKFINSKLPAKQDGGMTGMMKGRIATAAHFGNPAAQRMVSPNPKKGMTPEGEGTHYMASMGEYVVPFLQDKGGNRLEYNENPAPGREDMKFNSPEEAAYFAEHYKEVAPMMKNYIEAELTDDEIEEYRKGGYIVEDISVPSLNQRQEGGTEKPINAANPYWILDEGEPFKVRPFDAQLEYNKANQTFENRIPQSGMIEESDIDPTDVLSLGAGLAKTFGKGISKALLKSGARRLVTKSITPIGYDPFTIAAAPLELLTPKALKFKPKTYATKNRYDAWKLYNGLEPEFNTFSKNLDGTLAINDFRLSKYNLQNIIDNPKKSFGTTDIKNEFNFGGVHGNGWITKGVDEKGKKFIDFTDTWDLQPLKNVKGLPDKLKEFEVSSLTGGKPFDLKNRIYYDDAGNFFDHKGTKLVEEVQHFPKGIVKQNEAVDEIMLSTPNVVGTKQIDVLKDWNKAVNQKFFKGAAAGFGSVFAGLEYHLNKLKEKSKKDLDKKAYGGTIKKFGKGGKKDLDISVNPTKQPSAFTFTPSRIPGSKQEAESMLASGELKERSNPLTKEDVKLAVDAASVGFYPAAVLGSAMDAAEGNYISAALGLIPVVGKAGKHGKFWGKAYTKAINAGVPNAIAYPAKKYGKAFTQGSSIGTNIHDVYNDFNQNKKAYGGYMQEGGIKNTLTFQEDEESTLSDEEFFNQPNENEISDKPTRSMYISDPRKIRATTGKKIRPNVDLKSGEYDVDAIEKLAEYAVLRGINPYRAIAQALAESTLGTKTPDNVGHTRHGKNKNMYTNMMDAIIEGDSLAKVKGKTKPEEIIQGYNRYGKLTSDTEKDYHGGKVTGFYGVKFPKETGYLDMNKTPLYGIEVLDLQKNVLEPNEKIRSIVQPQLHPRPPKPAIQYFNKNRPEFSKGGVVAKLSQKEIDDYIKQGYIVEEE